MQEQLANASSAPTQLVCCAGAKGKEKSIYLSRESCGIMDAFLPLQRRQINPNTKKY